MTSKKTNSGFEVGRSDNLSPFIPAFFDDYGYTPEEFRILSRILRRAVGGSDGCFESVPNLAKALFVSDRLVRRALQVLESCGAIKRVARPGKTDRYDFISCEKWKPSRELSGIRAKIDAEMKRKDRARKVAKKSQVVAETLGVENEATPCGNARGVVAETTPPVVAETLDEGYPIEGNPIKVNTTDATASLGAVFTQPEIVQECDPLPSTISAPDVPATPSKESGSATSEANQPPRHRSPEEKPAPAEKSDAPESDQTMWDVWVRIEKSHGILEQTARKRLGGLIKEFGTELVSSAISESLSTKADPFAYLKATLAKLKAKKTETNLQGEQWYGEQQFIVDDFTRQMIPNPYYGDPRYLPNFPVPKLIPEWYRATAQRLQSREASHVV